MKVCIPVKTNAGLQAEFEAHLPAAPTLLVFDTERRTYHYLDVQNAKQSEENTLIHVVLCGSINRHALRSLLDQGIAVYGTAADSAAEALRQFEAGELEAVSIAAGAGHHQGHGGCGGHDQADAQPCCGGSRYGEADHECCGGSGEGCGCGGHQHAKDHECCGGANHDHCATRA